VRWDKDERPIHVAITVSPIRDDAGHVIAGTAMVCDISSTREAAEALRSSEELMRMVIENATEYAIFSTDLHRHITVWNTGAERLLGYTEREVLGRAADIIFVPEDRASHVPNQEAATALAGGRSADDRFHQRKDGSHFWASGSLMLMRDANGEAAGFVKILRDQTAAREVQKRCAGAARNRSPPWPRPSRRGTIWRPPTWPRTGFSPCSRTSCAILWPPSPARQTSSSCPPPASETVKPLARSSLGGRTPCASCSTTCWTFRVCVWVALKSSAARWAWGVSR